MGVLELEAVSMPDDLWREVFRHCPLASLGAIQAVSKDFARISAADFLWVEPYRWVLLGRAFFFVPSACGSPARAVAHEIYLAVQAVFPDIFPEVKRVAEERDYSQGECCLRDYVVAACKDAMLARRRKSSKGRLKDVSKRVFRRNNGRQISADLLDAVIRTHWHAKLHALMLAAFPLQGSCIHKMDPLEVKYLMARDKLDDILPGTALAVPWSNTLPEGRGFSGLNLKLLCDFLGKHRDEICRVHQHRIDQVFQVLNL